MKLVPLACTLLAALAGTATISAQPTPATATSSVQAPAPRQRTSPHDTISARIDTGRITVVYGRPYSKNSKTGELRKVWGALIPAGKPWRTGADEATLFITQLPLDLAGTHLPAGAYTLYTLLAEDGSAQLLINKRLGQWGADPYDATQEFARVPLTKEPLEPQLDQFTMALERNPAGGGTLRLKWETTQYPVPFTVKK
ncbi:MAG TPA: DUF2911 domain-containing protein [Lacunisphaera sp.]|nr:DUF2911 domain-containing protein [Lacunisphaera sp.]